MKYILFDIVFTSQAQNRFHKPEVLEISAIKLNSQNEIEDIFNLFVKPEQDLSKYGLDKLRISEEVLSKADNLSKVLFYLEGWIGEPEDYVFICWDSYCKNQFELILKDLGKEYINPNKVYFLKDKHADMFSPTRRPMVLEKAFLVEEMDFYAKSAFGMNRTKGMYNIFKKHIEEWEFDI